MSTVFRLLLLAGLLVCAVATALVKKPLRAVIIYMAYSIIMVSYKHQTLPPTE